MSDIIPLVQSNNPAYLFSALQVGQTIPPLYGGTGVSAVYLLNSSIALSGLSDVSAISPSNGESLVWNGTKWAPSTIVGGGGPGVTDHGALTGLSDNDHPQYVLSATNLNLSSDVTSHTSNTSNPHNVTPTQVSCFAPNWNASAIQSIPLNISLPDEYEVLGFLNGSATNMLSIRSLNGETGNVTISSTDTISVIPVGTDTLSLIANNTSAFWNASALNGYPLSAVTPQDFQTLTFINGQWVPSFNRSYRYTSAVISLTDVSSFQPVFPTSGSLTVSANCVYELEGTLRIDRSNPASITLSFSSNATINNISLFTIAQNNADGTNGTAQTSNWLVASSGGLVIGGTAGKATINFKGHMSCSSSGLFIIGISFNGVPSSPTLRPGSYISAINRGLMPGSSISIGDFV